MMMSTDGAIAITALGMATALAPNMPDSCAAFRAGIRRASDLGTVDPGEDAALGEEPIAACRAAYLAEGYTAGAKVVLLGGIALSDLLLRGCGRPAGAAWARTGLVLHLSDCSLLDAFSEPPEDEEDELPSAAWRKECAALVPRMLAGSGLNIAPKDRYLSFGGHAGFVAALQTAAGMVAGGEVDRCLAGAVDSCVDSEFLLAAAMKGVLKTAANPVGFVPGEAAAFVLLERAADPSAMRLRCGPVIDPAGEVPDGAALARAIRELPGARAGKPEIGVVIGDLNGSEYRARNWGSALARLRNAPLSDAPLWIPALGFGETGSAAGAVGLCLAARALERGHARGAALAWLSDDNGAAAAFTIASGQET